MKPSTIEFNKLQLPKYHLFKQSPNNLVVIHTLVVLVDSFLFNVPIL